MAVACDPGNAAGHKALGESLAEQQRFAEAARALEKAVRLSPKDTSAKELLERVRARLKP